MQNCITIAIFVNKIVSNKFPESMNHKVHKIQYSQINII